MSYEEHAAGVADDYRDALEGLTNNTRVEINNLTLIARENTEFAFVIANVLQEHIKKVGHVTVKKSSAFLGPARCWSQRKGGRGFDSLISPLTMTELMLI